MMQLFSLLVSCAALFCEGFLVATIVLSPRESRALRLALAYPLGAFVQTLLFFLLAIAGLPWALWSVGAAHALAIGALFLFRRFGAMPDAPPSDAAPHAVPPRLLWWAVPLLAVVALSSIAYASTIPSFYWDAFTNWAMRSKASFVAGGLLLDGVVQPQYPILIHSLQMGPMFLAGWHDRLANMATLVLSLTGFSALFLLLRRRGAPYAALMLALIVGVPLVVIHLRQSYADVHLSLFVLLSAALLDRAVRTSHARSLLLSAVFCAAAMWTKLEGVYAGALLWLLVVGVHAIRTRDWSLSLRWGIGPLLALTLPWMLFLWGHGLKTSPHGFRPSLHLDAVPLFFRQLLLQGMFGLHWWAIFSLLAVVLVRQARSRGRTPLQPSLLWGIGAFAFFAFAYLCTEEVSGLIHADNFSRALMMPTLLLTYAIGEYCSAASSSILAPSTLSTSTYDASRLHS